MVRPVVMELRGGLGNQLFCWARAYSISRELEVPIAFSARFASKPLAISELAIPLTFAEPSRLRQLYQRSRVFRFFRNVTGFGTVIHEKDFGLWEDSKQLLRGKTLRGHFQELEPFGQFRSEIIPLASKLVNPSSRYEALSERLSSHDWVAVHVRGGDYFKHQDLFQMLGVGYYARAIRYFRERGFKKLVVFTNDISNARQLLAGEDYLLIDDEKLSPAETLVLGTTASGLIGANSTFSWWMGYLMDEARIKVFPSGWYSRQDRSEAPLFGESFRPLRFPNLDSVK